MGMSLETLVNENSAQQIQQKAQIRKETIVASAVARLKERLTMMIRKSRGGGMQPPPAMSWKQSSLTFVGAFLTLLAVCRLNVSVIERFGVEYGIVLGPIGALTTLLYGLTSAPASQPKNTICAQIFSMTIAISIGYLDGLELWFRQALVTALAIAGMVKLGWTHPPAGASAMIFASVGLGWESMVFMITGNMIAIGIATIVNNLSDKRQYPSYWSIPAIDVDVKNVKLEVNKS
jgi:CBS-domain-containing membrane protein